MRAVIQRVARATVSVDGEVVGAIGPGLLAYVAAAPDDGDAELDWLARKLAEIRIFDDAEGRMNRSLADDAAEQVEAGPAEPVGPPGPPAPADAAAPPPTRAAVLLIPQFTLYADTRKGRRPSFTGAAPPDVAAPLLDRLAAALRARGLTVQTGRFGAHMLVDAVNDGPVTIILDSADLHRPRRG